MVGVCGIGVPLPSAFQDIYRVPAGITKHSRKAPSAHEYCDLSYTSIWAADDIHSSDLIIIWPIWIYNNTRNKFPSIIIPQVTLAFDARHLSDPKGQSRFPNLSLYTLHFPIPPLSSFLPASLTKAPNGRQKIDWGRPRASSACVWICVICITHILCLLLKYTVEWYSLFIRQILCCEISDSARISILSPSMRPVLSGSKL